MLSKALTDVLVCPKSKQPLIYVAAENLLVCAASRLAYRIEEGVPVLLIDEASEVSGNDADRLVKRAKDLKLPGA